MTAWLLALALAPAAPQSREDNPHFVDAVAAWDEGRWADAARAFEAAFAIDPRPEYVFARGRAERLGGDCAAAIATFERFLALESAPAAVADARTNIDECRADTRATEASPTASTPVQSDLPPAPRHTPRSWGRDPLGHALVWPGVGVLATGVGLVVAAQIRRARAEDERVEDEYRDAIRGAPTLSKAGIALASVGGALLVAGIVRFAVMGARQRSPRRTVALLVDAGGVGLAW